jgi:RNase H-like domain found in reverse transcriptase/Integrase zinc binding domain/Reverse transcriptase (RNA-dependent DNA polymerase)
MATLAPVSPQDTPPPTVHSLFFCDRDDSAELESACTCRINPFSTAIYHCNALQHSFLTANSYTPIDGAHLDATSNDQSNFHDHGISHRNAIFHTTTNSYNNDTTTTTTTTTSASNFSSYPVQVSCANVANSPPSEKDLYARPRASRTAGAEMYAKFTGLGRLKIWTRWDWDYWARTMYKRKDKKVRPQNVALPGGVKPGGNVAADLDLDWRKIGDNLEMPAGGDSEGLVGLKVPRGSRLTPARLERVRIGVGFLSEPERKLFIDILYEFEGAVAFEDSEMGLVKPEIEPPVVIHTVPHDPWQQNNIRLPKATQDAATAIVKEKQKLGILEHSQGPYRSRYFLVAKKSGQWRFINDVQPLNGVTIKESGMPPSVDEFSEDFAEYPITTAIDYYSGYYEVGLHPASRDMTAFMTDVGLMRMTRLPQGWTNSVSTFQRIISKVHWPLIPHKCRPFIDDCALKGPKSRYNDEEISPGIRRFVYEHSLIFREFMQQCWTAGLTISGEKCAIGMPGVTIVGYVCDQDGRRPEPKTTQRIQAWPTPRSVRDARAFIGIAVYYRIFIKDFSVIAAPIFSLFKKGKRFEWTSEMDDAMKDLKGALMKAPVLVSLDFSDSALGIELGIDASTSVGWGAVLSQFRDDGKLHPARFESGIWSDAEKKYDALKLECRGLIKALKKLRFWLFGRFFTVTTDSQTLVWLLNQPPNDLPNAMMTRWLAYARLFDFDVHHVKGTKNGAADGLSRRGKADEDESDSDPDEYFESRLFSTTGAISHNHTTTLVYAISYGYSDYERDRYQIYRVSFDATLYEDDPDDALMGQYLTTLQRPDEMTDSQYQQLRKKSKNFFVRDGFLFKRPRHHGIPPRRVIGMLIDRKRALEELHDEKGHMGKKATYNLISKRYQWKGMYSDVAEWVKTCDECQKRSKFRFAEPLHPTWTITVWEKMGLDVIYMPWEGEVGYIVLARDDLSGWVEGRTLTDVDSESVARFLQEDVFCRHGVPQRIVMDGGRENLKFTEEIVAKYGMKGISIAPYHPQSNGLVERGHRTIIEAIAKYKAADTSRQSGHYPPDKSWTRYLSLALWADRITTRRPTGYSAFEMIYGRECLLPVQLTVKSWSLVEWDDVKTHEDLILARMRQLDERVTMEDIAAKNQRLSRMQNKAYFDETAHLRRHEQVILPGDLVLVLRPAMLQTTSSRSRKIDERWEGPYRIIEKPMDSTYYILEELDGTLKKRKYAGEHVKKYFPRIDHELQRGPDPDTAVSDNEDEDDITPNADETTIDDNLASPGDTWRSPGDAKRYHLRPRADPAA